MLDNFICYRPFFCRVKDCKVVNKGMRSNHTAILTIFKILVIKLKLNEKVVANIERKLIGYHNLTADLETRTPSTASCTTSSRSFASDESPLPINRFRYSDSSASISLIKVRRKSRLKWNHILFFLLVIFAVLVPAYRMCLL